MSEEWNSPIDQIQADCMSLRELIRGWIGDAKERARRWVPAPCPRRDRESGPT